MLFTLGKAELHMQATDEPTSNSVDGVSDERFARLAKGVNLSYWLWLAPSGDFDPDAYTERDMQLLQAAGMTHVRLPFEPEKLTVDVNNPGQMREDYLAEMDRAISMALKYDLAVIVDPHPQNDFRYNMATDDEYVARMTQLWHALAVYLSKYDPEMVFLETMNEPAFLQFMDAEEALTRWESVQELLVAALRAGAPNHTIIVKGDQWDNIDSLLQLEVFDDRNIIYNIHFYDPFIFTHQGADWSDQYLIGLENVPYPSSLQAIAPLLDVYSGEQREAIYQYGSENWNADTVSQAVKVAADWAAENNVRLTANEFGVYKPTTAAGARYALLHDMRVAFEQYNIGWTMWDYQGGFDLVEGEGDTRYITPEMTEALGLNIVLASR
jgi:aryl-phospho-beta-D-glucosidase BglC (GH1 family)